MTRVGDHFVEVNKTSKKEHFDRKAVGYKVKPTELVKKIYKLHRCNRKRRQRWKRNSEYLIP